MNWDTVAAIAEVFGVIGVIVSIGYLAIQVRQSNRVAEETSLREIFAVAISQFNSMGETGNCDVLLKGLVSYDQLNGRDKFAFDALMTGYLALIESSMLASDVELLSDETMENWKYHIRTRFLPYEGVRSWWAEARGSFPPKVHSWVDGELHETDMNSDIWGIKNAA